MNGTTRRRLVAATAAVLCGLAAAPLSAPAAPAEGALTLEPSPFARFFALFVPPTDNVRPLPAYRPDAYHFAPSDSFALHDLARVPADDTPPPARFAPAPTAPAPRPAAAVEPPSAAAPFDWSAWAWARPPHNTSRPSTCCRPMASTTNSSTAKRTAISPWPCSAAPRPCPNPPPDWPARC